MTAEEIAAGLSERQKSSVIDQPDWTNTPSAMSASRPTATVLSRLGLVDGIPNRGRIVMPLTALGQQVRAILLRRLTAND